MLRPYQLIPRSGVEGRWIIVNAVGNANIEAIL